MRRYSEREIRFIALRTAGNFLVLASFFGLVMTFGPAIENEITYRVNRARGISYVAAGALPVETVGTEVNKPEQTFADIEREGDVRVLTPVDTDFGIIIPKIAANAKVIPEVDPANYDLYIEALGRGVAHALGTYFPGEGGNIYLFSHSTDNFWNVGRYNALFYLLKELEPGDEINLYYKGRRYMYRVSDTAIVEPTDVQYLTNPSPGEQVTMQTCWPPGTTFKRLIVIAKPISDL